MGQGFEESEVETASFITGSFSTSSGSAIIVIREVWTLLVAPLPIYFPALLFARHNSTANVKEIDSKLYVVIQPSWLRCSDLVRFSL